MEILIILSLIIIFLQIVILKVLLLSNKKNYKVKKEKKEEVISDDYLYSLEFNSKLDDLIRSFLNKYDNDTIVNKVYTKLKSDSKVSKIDDVKLRNHIKDILRNYTNHYYTKEILDVTEEEIEKHTTTTVEEKKSTVTDKVVSLAKELNDFYNDI